MEVIIEQLTRGHKLIGCHKFSQPDITIGRAYSSDLIVSDPHVCPKHLQLHFDGEQWLIDDQSSINGSYLEQSKAPVKQYAVQSGDVICFGKSMVRIVFPEHPIAETIEFSPFEQLVDFARQPIVLITNIALFVLVAAWIFYINKPMEVNFTQLAVPAIGMALGFSMWPAMVALVSHFTKNDARVLHQFGICFMFFNLMWLSDSFESIVHFNTSANMSITGVVAILPIAIAFCMFWLNCYVGFHMSAQRRAIAAVCLTTLLFGGSMLVQISKEPEFSPLPHYDSTLMTPSFLFSSSSDVDTFIRDSERLFDATRKAAENDTASDN
ncbi:FHA domain-containing protein [Thalassotalea atypica]|uniref:FHA domain-containing protein n=1 Tax=Thalassotalea atypica TaxID=2054316 RepID=UPI002573BA36|nr:FHA domain-containing protein [Thalassotalea atypica]